MPAIFDLPSVEFLGEKLQCKYLLTIGIGFLMMISLLLFVKRTKYGKIMRVVPQDKEASKLMGIHVNKIITITFAIGSGLDAVAAIVTTALADKADYILRNNPHCIAVFLYAFKEACLRHEMEYMGFTQTEALRGIKKMDRSSEQLLCLSYREK